MIALSLTTSTTATTPGPAAPPSADASTTPVTTGLGRSGHRPLTSIIIAGGGTGGHVFPGIAIADEVRRRNPEAHVGFIGTTRGLEARLIPQSGYALHPITVSRLKGGGFFGKLKGLLRLPIAIFQSWRILRRHKPQVVIGVGGYASGPALLASWLTFRRTAIQEQNATPGLTNRWLGKIVKRVFTGFSHTSAFSAKKVLHTGNPIRHAIAARLAQKVTPSDPAALRVLRVLVFGGSQGATFLNEQVPPLLAAVSQQLGESGRRLEILHQTGERDLGPTGERYAALSLPAEVRPFIDDMPAAYGRADLAICRSGALTLAELTAVGLPSVLVPFPFAADDHQDANARVLERAGAAIVAPQKTWDAGELAGRIAELATDPAALAAMATAAASLGRPDAVMTIVDHLEALAR